MLYQEKTVQASCIQTFDVFVKQPELVINQQKYNTSNQFQVRCVPPERENNVNCVKKQDPYTDLTVHGEYNLTNLLSMSNPKQVPEAKRKSTTPKTFPSVRVYKVGKLDFSAKNF